ncbi:MAG: hypothetical protein HY042_07130, partial [Spirochaetia bacterium]|nr:hypothetical protein [Spirochaetia bacterium]
MQRKRPTRKQYIVAAGIVAVLAAGILWLLFSGGSDRAKRHPGKDDQEVPLSDKDGLPIINEDPAEALAYFRKWAKYPPYSRPLAGHELSEANPFLGNKLTNRVVVKPPGDCAQTPEGVKCLKEAVYSNVACEITPESSISVGKKDFRIFLSCSKFENAEKQPQRIAKLDIQQTKIEHLQYDQNMAKAGSLPPLHVGDDGMGG